MKTLGFHSRLLRFGDIVLRYSAIETDRGKCAVSIRLHRGGRSLYHRRLRTDTVWSLFGRCCYYRGDSGSYITSISNAKSYKHWIEVRPIDRSLIFLIHLIFFSFLYIQNSSILSLLC